MDVTGGCFPFTALNFLVDMVGARMPGQTWQGLHQTHLHKGPQ